MPLGRALGHHGGTRSRYAGVVCGHSEDAAGALAEALVAPESGVAFDFAVLPLAASGERRVASARRTLPGAALPPPVFPSDLALSSAQWTSQVVGAVSAWVDADSRDPALARDSAAALDAELAWAAHLSLQAAVVPRLGERVAATAHSLLRALGRAQGMSAWVRVPLVADEVIAASSANADAGAALLAKRACDVSGAPGTSLRLAHDPFEAWHELRAMCGHHPRLCVALEVGADLPDGGDAALERWLGEPVRAALISTDAFLTNKHGYPTLSKRHQKLVSTLLQHDVQIVLHGPRRHEPPPAPVVGQQESRAPAHPLAPYLEYVSFLYRRLPAPSECEVAESSYRDFLQSPLQPLMDNLESATYETFERDATKYDVYQQAVETYLREKVPDEQVETADAVVLMMVGAGRGPILSRCLAAADATNRRVRVYAIEKNPNAVVTLQRRAVAEGWGDRVTLIASDMRDAEPPELADCLVSELLGSFGDNELSPECLDGAQRFLKEDGVSIPQEYTSYIAPISASKLHAAVGAMKGSKDDREHYETPYVVKLHSIGVLADTQEAFTFAHPNRPEGGAAAIDNRRYKRFVFEARAQDTPACVHGFAGYFDAKLYGDVHLSIHPPTHTPDMSSWFAIYFPLQHPVHWPAGAALEAHMWRDGDARKVWYEWCVGGPTTTHIHNTQGRSYWVGL